MLSTEKTILLLSVLVLTLSALACGGGSEEPDTPTPPTAQAGSEAPSAPASFVEGEPTVIGDCENGMTMNPGEGCHFSGLEGRPADLVISVGADGEICREKGSVTMSGFPVGMNRACADKYEVIDVLEAEIKFEPNGDGSWTVTSQQ